MSPASPQSIRVLLVDDHQSVLWGLEKLIQSARPAMEVVGKATNRSEALAAIIERKPDVVLLDLDLGGESGLALLPDLQKRSAARVLVLTGMRDPELRQRAMLDSACGMVHKVEPAEVILKAITQVHGGEIWLDRATTAKLVADLRRASSGEAQSAADALTRKEREVIAAVVKQKGAPNKVIAATIHISSHTLRNHLASIYSKLGVHNRLELFMYAKENRLDELAPEVEQSGDRQREVVHPYYPG